MHIVLVLTMMMTKMMMPLKMVIFFELEGVTLILMVMVVMVKKMIEMLMTIIFRWQLGFLLVFVFSAQSVDLPSNPFPSIIITLLSSITLVLNFFDIFSHL